MIIVIYQPSSKSPKNKRNLRRQEEVINTPSPNSDSWGSVPPPQPNNGTWDPNNVPWK
jgi:hypothetical protein